MGTERALPPAERKTLDARRLVALNTVWQIGVRATAALVGVAQAAILSHYLHSNGYGQYSFVLATIGMGGVLTDMGILPVTVRMLAGADSNQERRVVGGALVAKSVLSTLAIIISDVFAIAGRINPAERNGILLLSALYLLWVPNALAAVFQAKLEMYYPLALGAIQSALGLGLTAALIALRAPLLMLLSVQLATAAIGGALLFLVAFRRYALTFRPNLSVGMRMLRDSIPIGLGQAFVVLYFRIDAVLLGVLRGSADVAHYTAAYRFLDLGGFVATAFVGAVYPLMVQMGGEDDRVRLLQAFQRSTNALMFVAIPLCVGFFILARPIVLLVFPPDFEPSVAALRILSLAFIPLFFNNVLGSLVLTLHREKTFLWVSVAASVLNIGLNLALIPTYGITAAAVVTVISELFVTVVGLAIMVRILRRAPSLGPTLLILVAAAAMGLLIYVLLDYWIIAAVVGGLAYGCLTRVLGVWTWRDVEGIARRSPRPGA